MSPKSFIFLCFIVVFLFLLNSSSSLSEETDSDSLSKEVRTSHIQPWKRFPCIVGTRYRVRRCRRIGRRFIQKQDEPEVKYDFLTYRLKILLIYPCRLPCMNFFSVKLTTSFKIRLNTSSPGFILLFPSGLVYNYFHGIFPT